MKIALNNTRPNSSCHFEFMSVSPQFGGFAGPFSFLTLDALISK
jgi:hypothetical protein